MYVYIYPGMNLNKEMKLGGNAPRYINKGPFTQGCIAGSNHEQEATLFGVINRVFITTTTDPAFHIRDQSCT